MWDVKLILCGDLAQFGAICDSWLGAPVADGALAASDMLRELVFCNRFRLTENKRSDPEIFAYITSLRPGEPEQRDLQEALRDAHARFPPTREPADWTIVMSHARRRAVNKLRNQALKPREGAVFCRWKPVNNAQATDPESLWVWPGLTVIGAGGKVLHRLGFIGVVDCPRRVHITEIVTETLGDGRRGALFLAEIARLLQEPESL
jgi:hypothetical protein